jgi:cytoskeletal protein CcmA (bactofilin family)
MFGKEKTGSSSASLPTISASPSGGGSASTKIETVIGPTANFKGTVQSDGGLRVDGVFEGNIQLAGNLIIGESGKVIAEVTAQNVSVAGALKGTVKAVGRLEILSNGRVWGDISVASFLIDEGGFFRGQSIMPGEADMPMLEAPVGAPAATTTTSSNGSDY